MNQPRPPRPEETPGTSSAAINVRHAKAQPTFRPVSSDGNAPGIKIWNTYFAPGQIAPDRRADERADGHEAHNTGLNAPEVTRERTGRNEQHQVHKHRKKRARGRALSHGGVQGESDE